MRRKKAEGAGASGAGGRVTPAEVQQVEFRLAFRGYNERDVDAFLDRITEDLAAYIEDSQRLRAGQPLLATPAAVGDVTSARTEAERIVAEAREEASRILRDAEARAARAGSAGGDTRAAVAPFLNTERQFLQSLGSLVQGHAEEIKQMVLALRAKAEIAAPAAAPQRAAQVTSEPEAVPEGSTVDDAFGPISVPMAEGAATEGTEAHDPPTPEPAPAALRQDSGERSLRELFWGED